MKAIRYRMEQKDLLALVDYLENDERACNKYLTEIEGLMIDSVRHMMNVSESRFMIRVFIMKKTALSEDRKKKLSPRAIECFNERKQYLMSLGSTESQVDSINRFLNIDNSTLSAGIFTLQQAITFNKMGISVCDNSRARRIIKIDIHYGGAIPKESLLAIMRRDDAIYDDENFCFEPKCTQEIKMVAVKGKKDVYAQEVVVKKTNTNGATFIVDLVPPRDELQQMRLQNCPLAPTNECIDPSYYSEHINALMLGSTKVDDCKKLVSNFDTKYNYSVHYSNLMFYIKMGYEVSRVHSVITYNESNFMDS